MFLVVVLLVTGVTCDFEPAMKTYNIEVPGSDPIRIVEAEPLWNSKSEERSLSTETEEDPLHQFLTNYANSVRKNNKANTDSSEKSKSWDLVQFQRPDHSFDDKKGWVSMDPVPWSVSKVSKWQSKYKPNSKPWEEYDSGEELQTRPPWNKPLNNFDTYIINNNKPKPSAVYNQKVQVEYLGNKYQHKNDKNCNHPYPHEAGTNSGTDIITDGLPPNFPQPYEANRRRGTDILPDNHPFSGDGDWVLLSTTKGYKYTPNQRQRSLQINPEAIGAHRSVRLTVLPPLKNSKVNMTTSHGGLLQVESSFQTVEQARKQYNKKQKLKKKPQQVKNKPVRQVLPPTTVTTTRKNPGPDSSAVLAAVGAGMIPATMAMLVPMALGGRRKREITTTPISITLPRNL